MSKQTQSKHVANILFLFLIVSIGIPFHALPILTGFDSGSEYAMINFFLGNGMVGKSIFDLDSFDPVGKVLKSEPIRYENGIPQTEQDTPSPLYISGLEEAHAQEPTYPIVYRNATSETTQLSETKFISKLGLPAHIQNNEGDYIANLFYEDVNGMELESGSISYYFDKNSCSMSIFDAGRIDPQTPALFGSNNWVTKVALNGTDNWSDVSQNFLPCVVTADISPQGITINSTKSDANGTMVELYQYDKYKGIKSSVYFTNNDPALNDHKFSFSNIMMDTPQNVNYITAHQNYTDPFTNSTIKLNYLTMYDEEYMPNSYIGSPVQKIGTGNTTETITINKEDMFNVVNVNGTDYYEQVFDGFNLVEKQGLTDVRNYWYNFGTDEDFEKLWEIKFVTHPDFTMDTYIDYANVTSILPVGQTTMIDPTTTTYTNFEYFTVSIGSIAGNCNSASSFGKSPTGFSTSVSISISGSKPVSCSNPVMIFDITGIPDEATPIRGTLQVNVTSYGCGSGSIFSICAGGGTLGYFQHSMNFYDCSSEDITVLPDVLLRQAIYGTGAGTICGATGTGGTQFELGGWGGFVGIKQQSKTAVLDNFLIDFEEHLENGDVRYNIVSSSGSGNGNSPIGAVHVGASKSGGAGSTWNPDEGTFLEVEWDFFTTPSEPLNVVCSPDSPTSILIDWDSPLSTGGRPIDFYNIERDSTGTGNAFTPLIQVPIFPTNYVDSTVIQGLGFLYRVAAENGEGVGTFSNGTSSCGIVGISGQVNDLSAFNQALNIVALDWTAPIFTGNTIITGYRVDRTEGTPNTDGEWTFIQHERSGIPITFGTAGDLLNFDDPQGQEWRSPTGCPSCTRYTTSQVEGLSFGTWHSHTGIGHAYIFKDFSKDELKNREMFVKWVQHKIAAGYSLQTFGDWETRLFVVDGVYDMTDANVVGGSGSFPANVAGAGFGDNVGLHLPSVGNGVILDCLDTVNNAQIQLGGNPVVATLPSTSQMEAAGHHELLCTIDDLSGASQDRVTFVFQLYDNQGSSIGCGSNCASSGSGSIVLDEIAIEGLGFWEFTDDLPLETVVTFDSVSETQSIFGTADTLEFVIGDGFITIENNTGNTNIEYLDNTVIQNTNYGYRVFVYNSEGVSDPSNVAVIFTAGAPDNVATPSVTATGTQTINIQWTEPELNGGTVDFYEIERKTGVGGIFATLDSTPDESYDDGEGLFALQSAQEYCYRVKIFTNVGSADDFSNEACATTFDAPSEVQNLIVTALDGSSVDMSFDTPLSDGGSAITGYKVERKLGAGAFITLDESTLIQNRNDTGLPIGTLITYRVTASNQFGAGDSSSASDTTDATPQVPQNFVCSSATPDSINLSWDTPQSFSPPTGYEIARNIGGGAFSTLIADTASTSTMYVDSPLLMDTVYGYRVLAHTPEGDTLFTSDVFCKVLGNPNFPPEDFQASFPLVIPHDMTLTWDIPNTFGIPIVSFVVERDDGAGFNEIATLPPNAVGMIDSNLDNDIQQKYRVKLTGSEGSTPYSVGIPATTNQTSHWHFEKTIDDTGDNKNSGTLFGNVNYNGTIHNAQGFIFDGSTRIEVDSSQENDYDFEDSWGVTTYYEGTSGGNQCVLCKASALGGVGWSFFIDTTDVMGIVMRNGGGEIRVLGSTNVTDGTPHFLAMGYNGNGTASGVSMMVDGVFENENIVTDTLVGSFPTGNALAIGGSNTGTQDLVGILDEIRLFGSGTLDEDDMEDVYNEEVESVAPINATMSLTGSTFSDISSEVATITLVSGYPSPSVSGVVELANFTSTTVNTVAGLGTIPANGILPVPAMFNTMGSLSNYTAIVTLDNGLEVFFVVSAFNLQSPEFTLPDGIDFFFQHARNPTFEILSFNFTRNAIPFDLSCNFKSELFANGTEFTETNVGFIQRLIDVPPTKDVVVACIDPNSPLLNPDEPSFGGSNALLTFVSFGDTTGIGAFLNFTDNYGDFFGAPVPFLFVILAAALFTGRSAPTGIIIVGVAIGIMWYLGILTIDPILWGVIITLVILGAIGGKKFL